MKASLPTAAEMWLLSTHFLPVPETFLRRAVRPSHNSARKLQLAAVPTIGAAGVGAIALLKSPIAAMRVTVRVDSQPAAVLVSSRERPVLALPVASPSEAIAVLLSLLGLHEWIKSLTGLGLVYSTHATTAARAVESRGARGSSGVLSGLCRPQHST